MDYAHLDEPAAYLFRCAIRHAAVLAPHGNCREMEVVWVIKGVKSQ